MRWPNSVLRGILCDRATKARLLICSQYFTTYAANSDNMPYATNCETRLLVAVNIMPFRSSRHEYPHTS